MRNLDRSFLKKMPIAHRGYHEEGIPENTLLAAENAIKHGYAIELDVRVTKDKKVIVFHDEYPKRLLGLDGKIGEYTYDEIKDINVLGVEGAHVPLLSEFLEFVNGRTPLLVELKAVLHAKWFVPAAVEILKTYKGDFVVQSFSPFYLMKLKKIAPEFMRGQLITKDLSEMPMSDLRDRINYFIVWLFGFTCFNWISQPDFYNIDIRCYTKYQKRYAIRNVLTFVVTDWEQYDRAMRCTDNVVFENMKIDLTEHEDITWANRP
ncbi:MAG: glycerophosphodiester phosphodiesterase [Clostridia bacterium]|nr:glycerophosphodiester phosphodiesterase [Clostridia bacterium]